MEDSDWITVIIFLGIFFVIICVMHFRVLEGAVNEGITLILILSTQLCLNKLPASIPPTPLFQLL